MKAFLCLSQFPLTWQELLNKDIFKILKPVAIHLELKMKCRWILKYIYLWVQPNSFIYELCTIQFKLASFGNCQNKMVINWAKIQKQDMVNCFICHWENQGHPRLPWGRPRGSELIQLSWLGTYLPPRKNHHDIVCRITATFCTLAGIFSQLPKSVVFLVMQ